LIALPRAFYRCEGFKRLVSINEKSWMHSLILKKAHRGVHPPVVIRLHSEFEDWLGDMLLESFPSFIITEEAKLKLEQIGFTGVLFDEVKITMSETFRGLKANRMLPQFVWLRLNGKAGREDFGTAPNDTLVVSERALHALEDLGIRNAIVAPIGS